MKSRECATLWLYQIKCSFKPLNLSLYLYIYLGEEHEVEETIGGVEGSREVGEQARKLGVEDRKR